MAWLLDGSNRLCQLRQIKGMGAQIGLGDIDAQSTNEHAQDSDNQSSRGLSRPAPPLFKYVIMVESLDEWPPLPSRFMS